MLSVVGHQRFFRMKMVFKITGDFQPTCAQKRLGISARRVSRLSATVAPWALAIVRKSNNVFLKDSKLSKAS